MAFPLFSPTIAADLVRAAVGQVLETAAAAATFPVRVLALLGQTELLVSRITVIADQIETLIGQVNVVVDAAAATVADASITTARASDVVAVAATTATEAASLLDSYRDTLRTAAPMLGRFVHELSGEEVTAAIRMVDQLPRLRDHLFDDVMPLLGKLDQVGPDLHRLLEVTEDLHLAIAGLPGLKLLRRRGEERIDEEQNSH